MKYTKHLFPLLIPLLLLVGCKSKQQATTQDVPEQKQAVVQNENAATQEKTSLLDSLMAGKPLIETSKGGVFVKVDSVPDIVKKIFPDILFMYKIGMYNTDLYYYDEDYVHEYYWEFGDSTYYRPYKEEMRFVANPYVSFNRLLKREKQQYVPTFEEQILCIITMAYKFKSDISNLVLSNETVVADYDSSVILRKGSINIDGDDYNLEIQFSTLRSHIIGLDLKSSKTNKTRPLTISSF